MTIPRVRHVPGWENVFLTAIKNGYNEKSAANMAGVGSAAIRHRADKDAEFKKRYEETTATRRARPAGGIF